jgi:hypothetical protein
MDLKATRGFIGEEGNVKRHQVLKGVGEKRAKYLLQKGLAVKASGPLGGGQTGKAKPASSSARAPASKASGSKASKGAPAS